MREFLAYVKTGLNHVVKEMTREQRQYVRVNITQTCSNFSSNVVLIYADCNDHEFTLTVYNN